MNWKQEAIRDLQNYQKRKAALENMRQVVHLLNDDYCSLRGLSTDSVSGSGGTGGTEGWIYLVWADALARNAFGAVELPLGIVTAFAGAPCFLFLMVRRGNTRGNL